MRDLDPFGPAGRARGVDDVGEVRRTGSAVEIRAASFVARLPFRVEAEDTRVAVRQIVEQPLLGEQDRDARVVEHEGEPLGGIGRVERHVGAARLEDGQEPHHHRRRPAGAQAHQHLGADAQGAKTSGQAVRPGVELGVGERLGGSRPRRRPPGSVPPASRSGDGRGSVRPG